MQLDRSGFNEQSPVLWSALTCGWSWEGEELRSVEVCCSLAVSWFYVQLGWGKPNILFKTHTNVRTYTV